MSLQLHRKEKGLIGSIEARGYTRGPESFSPKAMFSQFTAGVRVGHFFVPGWHPLLQKPSRVLQKPSRVLSFIVHCTTLCVKWLLLSYFWLLLCYIGSYTN